MNIRDDGRAFDQLREITLVPDYIKNVPGSVLIEQGDTRLVCTATYETRVPPFLRGKSNDKGWVQAEYAMLPGSTGSHQRSHRERQRVNSRSIEIQRFIGRALRTTFSLKQINGITIYVDTDVIQADGGTRCAAINGAMIVLVKTLRHLVFENLIPQLPEVEFLAAVSIGVKNDNIMVDLNYKEDSAVDADINIVSTVKGNIVEVQAFGEEKAIPKTVFQQVIDLGVKKNMEIIKKLKACLNT
jgi:ribonuclease PH